MLAPSNTEFCKPAFFARRPSKAELCALSNRCQVWME